MSAPAVPEYLNASYSGKPCQRGGTLIAEDVWDVEEHDRRLATCDDYRPEQCSHAGGRLHGLGCRWRVARDEVGSPGFWIRRYLCSVCGAVWQVLPAFLARHLHRPWKAIQSRLEQAGALSAAAGAAPRLRPKPSTTRRWLARLLATAIVLTQALSTGGAEVGAVIARAGAGCCRGDLVEALAAGGLLDSQRKLAQLAAWIHRLVPGVRLM
ncbi:MAG: hypothetical protein HYV63_20390 [Candidatus Schekmanbacteria bacterium]|nr:hypothetical protein [Candidatus Schekmanbacteria bacterium]